MDKNKFSDTEKRDLKTSAEAFRNLLESYALTDGSAKQCLQILDPLLKRSERMTLDKPLDDVPCSYTFHEGELRRYSDLESAYSKFAVKVKGVDVAAAKRRMQEHYPDFR